MAHGAGPRIRGFGGASCQDGSPAFPLWVTSANPRPGKGAIDGAELSHLTGLLEKIKPAIGVTTHDGQRSSANPDFVDAVAKTNVKLTVAAVRARSSVLAKLETDGQIVMRGAMYQLVGGAVDFFAAWLRELRHAIDVRC